MDQTQQGQAPVLVIVPTYQERQSIERLWRRLSAIPMALDLIVIDDNSDDGTTEYLRQLAMRQPSVTLIERPAKLGLGTAYTLALSYARTLGYQRVIQMDADGSHDTEDLQHLLQGCREHDLAIGSRYAQGGQCTADWPWRRRLLSRAANQLVAIVLGLGIQDATGGFRCMRGNLLRRLQLEQLVTRGFGWQWEFNRAATQAGATVIEVPIRFSQRVAGASKMSLSIMVESLWRLAMVRLGVAKRINRSAHHKRKDAAISTSQFQRRVHRREVLSFIIAALALLGMSRSLTSAQTDTGSSVIENAYFSRTSTFDPGTIVAVLQNTGARTVHVNGLSVNGIALRDWPASSDPVAWFRLSEKQLEPNHRAIVIAKLAQYTTGLVRLGIQTDQGEQVVLLSAARSEPVRIAALRYHHSGRAVNLFVENNGTQTEFVHEISFAGKSVWSSKHKPRHLPAGETIAIRMSLDETLAAGQRATLYVRLADRTLGASDRVIPGFRISIEAGDQLMARRIAADPLVLETYKFEQEEAEHAGDAAPSLASRQGAHWSMVKVTHGRFLSKQESDLACVFACPTHSTDSYQTSAYLASKAQQQAEQRPAWQTFIHCCRTQPLVGISIFGPLADAVRFNAALTTEVSTKDKHRDKIPSNVYRMTRFATRAAGPSVAMPMVMLEQDWKVFPLGAPLAIEARHMIYSALAGGAGGISYRVRQEKWGRENREAMLNAVKATNQEIRQIRGLLALGYPCNAATCSSDYVQVQAIDALPDGLVLIVINHDIERPPPELPPFARSKPKQNVKIRFNSRLGLDKPILWRLRGDKREKVPWLTNQDGVPHITIPIMREAELLVLISGDSQIEKSFSL